VIWSIAVIAAVAAAVTWFRLSGSTGPVRIALVTADNDPYWERLIKGAEAAAAERGATLTVMKADGTLNMQSEMMIRLAADKYNGVAISPIDAGRQALSLRRLSESAPLITVDSDSEFSGRICFVGADNYAAGRVCGEILKQAMPDGGNVIIVTGPMNKENGERRRQGVIDELLDRSYGPGRPMEPLDKPQSGATFTITATLIDEIDPNAAEANVVAALKADPSIKGIVGLYAYSTPAAVRGVEAAGMAGKLMIVGFDDRDETLDAVASGAAYATLAQDQYNYGFHAINMLIDAASGRDPAIPYTGRIHFPPAVVTAESVAAFRGARSD
jgi:ribose transport system substrate-binding protein